MRVLIIGGGIIGLSAAYQCLQRGLSVTVLDRDLHGDKCSLGNAAAIAYSECVPIAQPGALLNVPKWLLDPEGPLFLHWAHMPALMPWFLHFLKSSPMREVHRLAQALARLNDHALPETEEMMQTIGMGAHLHKRGAVAVYRSHDAQKKGLLDWSIRADYGVSYTAMDGETLRQMEPALGPAVAAGYFVEDWAHVTDPADLVHGLQQWLEAQGVVFIKTGIDALGLTVDGLPEARTHDGQVYQADHMVVAAGAWTGQLARHLGDRLLVEAERGYNTTLQHSGVSISREVLFSEEKFVAVPLGTGIRIGGAAEFAGLTRAANYKRSDVLLKLATRYFPDLDLNAVGKQWMGQRPSTPDTLPVIGPSRASSRVLYACGHGHLGLTQGAITGRLVAETIKGEVPLVSLDPYRADRFSLFG